MTSSDSASRPWSSRLFPWLAGVTGLAVLGYLVVLLWNRQLRHELARRRVELERAQRIAHLGDWSMDLAGDRIQWSDELFHMVGRSPCELDWPTLRRWIHPEERDAHEHYLAQLARLATEGESLPPLISHLLLRMAVRAGWKSSARPSSIARVNRAVTSEPHWTSPSARRRKIASIGSTGCIGVLSGINEAIVRLRESQDPV